MTADEEGKKANAWRHGRRVLFKSLEAEKTMTKIIGRKEKSRFIAWPSPPSFSGGYDVAMY
jgi:hypothetical protein